MRKKRAVIFDMDGVISDTQKFHAKVESALLAEYNIHMAPADISRRYAGVSDDVMFIELFREHGIIAYSIRDTVAKKWDLMRTIATGNIKAIPHARTLIQELKKDGFKLAVASASGKPFIEEVLAALDIATYFDVLVSAEEVPHGKPAPDIFLLAAERLGVLPEEAVVIEDGKSGMIAATAASMKSIGLVSNAADEYPATRIVTSLADVNEEMLNSL